MYAHLFFETADIKQSVQYNECEAINTQLLLHTCVYLYYSVHRWLVLTLDKSRDFDHTKLPRPYMTHLGRSKDSLEVNQN